MMPAIDEMTVRFVAALLSGPHGTEMAVEGVYPRSAARRADVDCEPAKPVLAKKE